MWTVNSREHDSLVVGGETRLMFQITAGQWSSGELREEGRGQDGVCNPNPVIPSYLHKCICAQNAWH